MKLSPARLIGVMALVFVLMQVVGPARTNPVSAPEQSLRSRRPDATAALAVFDRSCRDCHSNDTTWPWYSRIAPVSWLVVHDVNGGRGKFNLSEFGMYDAKKQAHALEEACDEVKQGEMPPASYVWMHGEAALRPGDVEAICSLSSAASAP